METTFLWSWNQHSLTPDPLMTRERAARLLRSWRRSKTQGRRDFALKRVTRGHYLVAAAGYKDEWATMVIIDGRAAK